MAQTNISIRMDAQLKKQFVEFCNDMGMSMTTAFCIFAKKAVREYRIPFEVGAEKPNAETISAMQEVDAMIKNGTGKAFNSVAGLFEEMNACNIKQKCQKNLKRTIKELQSGDMM